MRKIAVSFNGISIAYMLAVVNSGMALVNSFGLSLTDVQRASIVTFVNASLVLAVHLAHRVGEAATNDQAHELGKTKMDQASSPSEPV